MERESRPAWMSDELVKDIPEAKLHFLSELFQAGKGKKGKELMATILPLIKKAKEENLMFSSAEMNVAIAAVKKYSTPEELAQMEQLLQKKKSH